MGIVPSTQVNVFGERWAQSAPELLASGIVACGALLLFQQEYIGASPSPKRLSRNRNLVIAIIHQAFNRTYMPAVDGPSLLRCDSGVDSTHCPSKL